MKRSSYRGGSPKRALKLRYRMHDDSFAVTRRLGFALRIVLRVYFGIHAVVDRLLGPTG